MILMALMIRHQALLEERIRRLEARLSASSTSPDSPDDPYMSASNLPLRQPSPVRGRLGLPQLQIDTGFPQLHRSRSFNGRSSSPYHSDRTALQAVPSIEIS